MSGKSQKITITSDKGRLGQEEIDRMVREAEENAEVDKAARERVEAKNQLESYLYSLRASADTLKDKISDEDKATLTTTVDQALSWLEEHTTEEKEVYDSKKKEVETIANPIITKAYGAAPPPEGGPSNPPDGGDGPTVEEI